MGCPQAVFTCYAQRRRGRWYAHCLDLDIGAAGDSIESIERGLDDRVNDFVVAIMSSSDRQRVAWLFAHSNAWRDVLKYSVARVWHLIFSLIFLRRYHFFQISTPLTKEYLIHRQLPFSYAVNLPLSLVPRLQAPQTDALSLMLGSTNQQPKGELVADTTPRLAYLMQTA